MRQPKKEIDKRYEEKHKEERKTKNATFGTSMPRKDLERLNASSKRTISARSGWSMQAGKLCKTK